MTRFIVIDHRKLSVQYAGSIELLILLFFFFFNNDSLTPFIIITEKNSIRYA